MAPRAELVALLHDPVPPEAPPDRQDTLAQVSAVAAALASLGHAVEALPLEADLAPTVERLVRLGPGLVFNLAESVAGSTKLIGLAPGLLEALGLPFTGCDAASTFATTDKVLAKRVMVGAGIPTPGWLEPAGLRGAATEGGRFIVKPLGEDASVGLDASSVVEGAAAARSLLAERSRSMGGSWFAEAFVDGRELNLSVLEGPGGPEVLPAAEMRFEAWDPALPRIVDYAAKWDEASFAFLHTVRSFDLAPEDAALVARAGATALRCWEVFGLGGYARVDLRVDGAGEPLVLEVNANPCIAPDSGFVAAAARAGLSFEQVIERVVAAALARRA